MRHYMFRCTLFALTLGLWLSPCLWASDAIAHTHIGINPTWRPVSWDTPAVGAIDPDPTDDNQLWFFSMPPVGYGATPDWPNWAQSDGSPFLLLSPVLEDDQVIVHPDDPNKSLYTCNFTYTKANGYHDPCGVDHLDGWHSAHGPQGAWNLESIDANTAPTWSIYLQRVSISDNLDASDCFGLLPDDSAVLENDGDTYDLETEWLSDKSAWGIHAHMGFYFWLEPEDNEVSIVLSTHDASQQYIRSADTTFTFAKQVIVPTTGDVNLDGIVDVNDMEVVLDNFGRSGIVVGESTDHDDDHDHDHED